MLSSQGDSAKRKSLHGHWSSRMAFILAVTWSAVGLGNIWKFPYIAGQNGGGAFVLVYLVCVLEGRPHVLDLIKNDEISFIVNTTEGAQAISDSFSIRREALQRKVSYTTTIAGGRATLRALDHENDYTVHSLQQLHRGLEA